MNQEKVHAAVTEALREYVRARSATRKDEKGQTWSQGMTIVSDTDKRIEEMARIAVEAVLRVDDGRPYKTDEAKALQLGDVFTRYAIKDGVAVDEECVVLKATTQGGRTTIKHRRHNDAVVEVTIDATYLVSVVRPDNAMLRQELEGL